jgi:hypothetical protein
MRIGGKHWLAMVTLLVVISASVVAIAVSRRAHQFASGSVAVPPAPGVLAFVCGCNDCKLLLSSVPTGLRSMVVAVTSLPPGEVGPMRSSAHVKHWQPDPFDALKKDFSVARCPTLLVFDADGQETARFAVPAVALELMWFRVADAIRQDGKVTP